MATLPESSRWKRKPVDHCDVVMKGGITSGVIYPRALVELARHYRFRGMGGSSAGAIGAALGAAAEFGRSRGGFARLYELPDQLDLGSLAATLGIEATALEERIVRRLRSQVPAL